MDQCRRRFRTRKQYPRLTRTTRGYCGSSRQARSGPHLHVALEAVLGRTDSPRPSKFPRLGHRLVRILRRQFLLIYSDLHRPSIDPRLPVPLLRFIAPKPIFPPANCRYPPFYSTLHTRSSAFLPRIHIRRPLGLFESLFRPLDRLSDLSRRYIPPA